MRYSIAHELAHTLFADHAERVRYRGASSKGDEWQLEMLCNLAAAEFLMPIGSFSNVVGRKLDIHHLLESRDRYEVSAEAVFIRTAQLADDECAAFCASSPEGQHRYQLDYIVPSRAWEAPPLRHGMKLPVDSRVAECIAVGFTACGNEQWPAISEPLKLQAVGLPAYPGASRPRVAGLLAPATAAEAPLSDCLTYLMGDALQPRDQGSRVVWHVVNDQTPNWGGPGFAPQIGRQHPEVQESFRNWARSKPRKLRLGAIHASETESDSTLTVVSMVAQKGFGPSGRPRLRYRALAECLEHAADLARDRSASIHMPRIGCGEGGGRWEVISELVTNCLRARRLSATVYDPPGTKSQKQISIPF